jgi:hypothetical protein
MPDDILPLTKRQKPTQSIKSSEPSEDPRRVHKPSQAMAVENPKDLIRRLSRLRKGLQDIDKDDEGSPSAS